MRYSGWAAAVCCAAALLGSCARPVVSGPGGTSGQPAAAGPEIPPVAAPYAAPERAPQDVAPLDVRASADAADRLGRVAQGVLVDSGGYHSYRTAPEGSGETQDTQSITFSSADGNISCTGDIRVVACALKESDIPRPPRPANAPRATGWLPEIELAPGALSYGAAHGDVHVLTGGAVLPTGSTIRFGEVECLGEAGGLTCASYRGSLGFHVARDELVPLKSAAPLAPDARAEPRTPGAKHCGALVTERAIEQAAEQSWPTTGKLGRWQIDIADPYSCSDVQAVMTRREQHEGQTLWGVGVLLFDKGRFVGPATDRPYDNLYAEADPDDPAVVRLRFALKPSGTGYARARCQGGEVVLLDPVPDGAQQTP
ncbi:MAG: hypothetical protein ACRC20_01560 [Segniliparus sp.]|uniref:hypothetical protein n=1 Tax=Segniliparus sp. TaxID=2804064 RepID=UPI003F2F39FC